MTQTMQARGENTVPADPGGGVRGTWLWTWISVLSLIVFGYALAGWSLAAAEPWQAREVILAIAGVAALLASIAFIGGLRSGLGQRNTSTRSRVVLLLFATAPWVVASVMPVFSIEWALIPWMAVSLIAADLSARHRWWWLASAAVVIVLIRIMLAAVTGVGADFSQIRQLSDTILFPALVVMLPLTTVFQFWLWNVVLSLDAAKSERAELARAQERLRFASDLHNIQGHHLQVIALKSELAERILSRDPDAAATLIRETQELAREALEDTRRLVKGYRAVSFSVEADNAAAVLDAAGIRVTIDLTADLPQELDHLFGTQLREATTNIIRHTSASHVEIILSRDPAHGIALSISNDGVPEKPRRSDGTGIIGLTEQYVAAGGTLTATTDNGTFTLRGVVPQKVGAK